MRLTLVTPGPTSGTRASVFGDTTSLLAAPTPLPGRRGRFCGPEPACVETAGIAGAAPIVLPALAGPDFGSWAGLGLEQVLGQDPAGLAQWLADPTACPHGGESLARHLERVGALLDAHPWPQAGAVVVASPFTVRAALVHAMAASSGSLLHLDVPPGTVATISRHAGRWRCQSFVPPKAAAD
jgi:broad specificity phosphatase PhoE